MPQGKGTYGSQRGRPRKDAAKKLVGSKKREYKRKNKSVAHPEGQRAGDVDGHYKDYEEE